MGKGHNNIELMIRAEMKLCSVGFPLVLVTVYADK